jgi:cytochrome c oxidase assembly factor 5
MSQSCKELAESLLSCMKKTDCVKQGGDIKTCMREDVDSECAKYRVAYFECKRSGLDMRTRIRGQQAY